MQCLICSEDILKNNILVGLSCKCPYLYHDKCINKWLGLNNSCPNCRYKWKKKPFENYNTKDLLNLLEKRLFEDSINMVLPSINYYINTLNTITNL